MIVSEECAFGLHQRKELLIRNSDALIVLPGGTGTLEELFEAVSMHRLKLEGVDTMPVCVVNVDGFYDGAIMQLERCRKDGVSDVTIKFFDDEIEALEWCLICIGKNAHSRFSAATSKL